MVQVLFHYNMITLKLLSKVNRRFFSSTSCKLNSEIRVRFAPSPTGNVHLGGLRTALYNYIFAKQNNGKFILRIEDTDQTRLVPGSAEKIEEILNWANLKPDESPSIGGNYGPYQQSKRLKLYKEKAEQLIKSNRAYRCFCSHERLELLRKNQARNREKPRYDGKCKELSSSEVREKLATNGQRHVVRFALQPGLTSFNDLVFGLIENNLVDTKEGDPVILKADQFPTYHFANIVDDHEMKISHVLRGSEWISSTTKHVQLYDAFSWKKPKFVHFPLITMNDGSKMSKRNNQSHVQTLIDAGYSPRALINFLTNMGGGVPKAKQDAMEVWDLEKIVSHFDFSVMTCHSGSIDLDKLRRYSSNDLMKSWQDNPNCVVDEFKHILTKHSICTDLDDSQLKLIIGRFIDGRLVTLLDLLSRENSYIWQKPKLSWSKGSYDGIELSYVVSAIIRIVNETPLEDKTSIDKSLRKLAQDHDMKVSTLFQLIRKLLTNSESGLPVLEIFDCLGKPRLIDYLQNGLVNIK